MAVITIVGAGLMGSAVAFPLSDNGHHVRLVGTHLDDEIIQCCKNKNFHPRLKRELPENVTPYYFEEMEEALQGVETVVSGVNSLGVHWIGQALSSYVHAGQTIIAITKGLEVSSSGELEILPDIMASYFPAEIRDQIHLAAVGGPCIAGELAGRRRTCVVFGSRHPDAVESLSATFRTSYYRVWTTTDLVGLEYCAALKNAYALSIGMVLGMLEKAGGGDPAGAHYHNLVAAVFAEASSEISRMLALVGGSTAFAYGLPGVGDLYVTSVGGRTIRFGKLLGSGLSFTEAREIMRDETLEAVEIIRSMSKAIPHYVQQGKLGQDELPLMRALIDSVVMGKSRNIPLEKFFGGGSQL